MKSNPQSRMRGHTDRQPRTLYHAVQGLALGVALHSRQW